MFFPRESLPMCEFTCYLFEIRCEEEDEKLAEMCGGEIVPLINADEFEGRVNLPRCTGANMNFLSKSA